MLLICPSCSTHYEVTDGSIPSAGRSVKCAACGHTWMAGPWNRSNYAARKSFQPTPAAPPSTTSKPATYFSKPISASRGGAALAALFDDHAFDEDEPLIDGKCEAIEEKQNFISIEERLVAALSAAPIARLMEQEPKPTSPFRQEISAIADDAPQAALPALVASEPGAKPIAGSQTDQPEKNAARDAIGKFSSYLRLGAGWTVKAFNRLGDRIDALIPDQIFARSSKTKPVMTPGDEKVSEWRQRERRKARNRMTPLRFIGWLGWAASCVGVLYTVVAYEREITTLLPQSKGMYAVFGGPSVFEPVILKDINYRYALSDKGPVIELRGALEHTGDKPVMTPLVRADAVDANGEILTSWTFRIKGPRQLLPKMETPFLTRTLAPAGIAKLELGVVPEAERAAIELARTEQLAITGADDTGQQVFFMQKTTVGWDSGPDDPPPSAK